MEKKGKALVILSGGQDSTTCLYLARFKHKEVHAITFDYGQRHAIELEAARTIAEKAKVATYEVIKLPAGILASVSPLVSDNKLDEYESYEAMQEEVGDRTEKTFIPMRNALFLTIAANRAEALGCEHIYLGISQQDGANYHDCTEKFARFGYNFINEALGREQKEGCDIKIETPLINFTKAETVCQARVIPECWEALAWTHTAYDGKYPPTSKDHANILRAQGFLEAGFPDPLVVRAWMEGLMQLPDTPNYDGLREQE